MRASSGVSPNSMSGHWMGSRIVSSSSEQLWIMKFAFLKCRNRRRDAKVIRGQSGDFLPFFPFSACVQVLPTVLVVAPRMVVEDIDPSRRNLCPFGVCS